MQGKKILIQSNDYEIYNIPLPVKFLFGRQKNKSISSELSKIHPCFSDDCCFDSKISLSRKGFQAKVIVMNDYVLKKYKDSNSNQKIYSKEFKNKILFKKSKFNQNKSFYISIIIVAFLGIFTSVFLFQRKLNQQNSHFNSFQEESELINQLQINYPDLNKISDNALKTINENNGKIQNLSWDLTGFTEKLICNIHGIFPESLSYITDDTSFSTLSYNKEIPEFSITTSSNIRMPEILSQVNTIPKDEIRKLLKNFNITIQKENIYPYEIFFQGPVFRKQNNETFFEKMSQFCSDNNLLIEKITLTKSQNHNWNCQISFSETRIISNENILKSISHYAACFEKEEIVHQSKKQKSKETKSIKTNENRKLKENAKKEYEQNQIGKVVHEDGTVTSFYRTKEGKIEIKKK